ncbi:hypothetical protein CJ014_10945 [Pleomorphomonas carboxyditropha]|uniref:Uncharacterized protein n=1 Tax=Pleomorphomonas carboxyditropha TaxID=2023338 RepID=A0A2G9WYI2_9HYPH|nr:hypothetical protein CJ014_10945 [Pleomorphomonas carboxyditropha]
MGIFPRQTAQGILEAADNLFNDRMVRFKFQHSIVDALKCGVSLVGEDILSGKIKVAHQKNVRIQP